MLKKHKNALLEVIQKSGLDPTWFRAYEMKPGDDKWLLLRLWFKLTEIDDRSIFTIQVINSPIKFYVRDRYDFDLFEYKHTRFMHGFPERDWSNEPKFIDDLLEIFDNWLRRVAREYIEDKQLPDLWAQIEAYRYFVTNSTIPAENASYFTEEEKEDLRQSIHEFRDLIVENFKPSDEQTVFINAQLDYLSKAVNRLNRFDWRGLAISTLIGIAINLSVDTEKGRLLFRLFQQAFQAAGKLLQ